jgi:hypothetical protein
MRKLHERISFKGIKQRKAQPQGYNHRDLKIPGLSGRETQLGLDNPRIWRGL